MKPLRVLAFLLGMLPAAWAGEALRPAPEFALPAADGRTIRLSQLRNKVVILEFLQTG